jgi:hypothetical protein
MHGMLFLRENGVDLGGRGLVGLNFIITYVFFYNKNSRLSKENTKLFGRHIGKVVHSNPVIAFTVILEQLQAYDNQIPFVVDASRYLTDLSFDVFAYILMESLATGKDRLQAGGIGVRSWLKSGYFIFVLSSCFFFLFGSSSSASCYGYYYNYYGVDLNAADFLFWTDLAVSGGNLFRKHTIDLPGLLRYMFWQLSLRNTLDLVIVQELVGQMSGIKTIDDATELQLEALAGGEILRREAMFLESTRIVKRSSQRLVKGLWQAGLTLPFAVMLGQLRKECVFVNESTELKVLGWMQDNKAT